MVEIGDVVASVPLHLHTHNSKPSSLSFRASMASTDFSAIFFAFIISFLFIIFFRIWSWSSNGVVVPWNWPILGMTPHLVAHFHRVHDRIAEVLSESGRNFFFKGVWFSDTDFFLTADPSNINHILSVHFERYPKGLDFKQIFDILGDGIFNSDSNVWKEQRKTAHSLVSHKSFLQFLEKVTLKKVKEGLIPVLENVCENGSVLDLQDLFMRFSFDSICMFVTGFDFHSLSLEFPQVPFSKAVDEAEEVIVLRHVFPKRLWEFQNKFQIGQAKRMKEAWEIIDQTIAKLLASKSESLKKKEEEGVDLITSYMKNNNNDRRYLRDTLLNFLVAGRDTLSSTLSWTFFCLSKNPIVVEKIREELKTTIPMNEARDQWRIFSIEEVDKLVYFHGTLCEVLRLYPPIPINHKVAIQHDILPSGHHIKPKMKILLPIYALGRMSDVWGKDCMDFKPERWISENGKIKHVPSYKFLAFNAGPRTCLGKQVSFTELKIVVAAIIHNYNIIQQTGHQVVPKPSVVLYMKHGFKVKVTKRWT